MLDQVINDSIQKIGEIKLDDNGFSASCSEAHAIEILKKEACAIQADIINIVEEYRADLWSSCYRCKAEFYKYKDTKPKPTKEEYYQVQNVQERVEKDRKQNTLVGILAVAVGFALGYYLFQ